MSTQDNKAPALGAQEQIIITPSKGDTSDKPSEDAHRPPQETAPAQTQLIDDPGDEKPLHLDFPAPTFEQVGEKISTWGMRLPGFSAEWQTRGETQCIRSKVL